jgi:hypothetical protein
MEVRSGSRVSLTYTKRWMNNVLEDMSADGLATFFLGNPGSGIASAFPKAKRDYDAFTLQYTRAFRDSWLLQGSYTLSWLRGNIAGLADGFALIPNHTANFDTLALTYNRTGPLPGDQRHSFKVFGAKEWTITALHQITTGLALRAHSGGPTNYFAADPNYGLREAYLLPRGSGERLPWEASADIQLGYKFALDRDQTLTVSMDVFNFLNFQSGTERDEVYSTSTVTIPHDGTKLDEITKDDGTKLDPVKDKNPNFGHITGYQRPRVFRIGARLTF